MNCPYCGKDAYGLTGFQEAQAFEKHLRRCRRNPVNIVLKAGRKVAVVPVRTQSLKEALEIRAESGQ